MKTIYPIEHPGMDARIKVTHDTIISTAKLLLAEYSVGIWLIEQ